MGELVSDPGERLRRGADESARFWCQPAAALPREVEVMALRRWSDVDVELLDELCRRYGISELLVFGSAARGEDTPDSDLDLLYELRPGARLGWEIEQLSEDLAELFGRPVDLISRRAINPHLGAAILRDARPLYAA